jgi:hypothetical protein
MMTIKYGQEITWTSITGDKARVSVDGGDLPEEAVAEAIKLAKRYGWTPPKWWQFWRWSDTRPTVTEGVKRLLEQDAGFETS